MPTYDYVCDACGHAFELFQGMRDPVKRTCPECKARKLRRLIGTGAAILVGGRSSEPTPSENASETKSDSATDTDGSGKSTEPTAEKKGGEEKAERTMSGSTSTPTHEAREHRGIGNLVDAARRTRQSESSKKTSGESAKSKPRTEKPAKNAAKPSTRSKSTTKKSSSASKRKPKKNG